MLIPEFNPYACDVTVYVLAVHNGNVMGFTIFNANRMSTWKPNLLSITREDISDEDRPWISGQIFSVFDEIMDFIQMIEMIAQMIKENVQELQAWVDDKICKNLPIWLKKYALFWRLICKQAAEEQFQTRWIDTFTQIHKEKKHLVDLELKGKSVSLLEEANFHILKDALKESKRVSHLRLKSENKASDANHQMQLRKIAFMQSGIKEFLIYTKNMVDSINPLLSHPLFETRWDGLRIFILQPRIPFNPKSSGDIDFYKQTKTEQRYGGAIIF